jgi:hypothetical protein
MAKRTGLVVVAALALAAPVAAQADKGGLPQEKSCGEGTQSYGCTDGQSQEKTHRKPVASAAQAGTITMTLREREDEDAFAFTDADHSGTNSVGDSARGRIDLLKGRRVVGVVRFHATLTAQKGPTTYTLHEEDVVTLRRQGGQRGGHLYVTYDHDEDFNRVPKVGDSQTIQVARGDGRYQGYSGQIVTRVVKVDRRGNPTFIDRITLHRAA